VFANFQTLNGGTGGDTFNVTVTGAPSTALPEASVLNGNAAVGNSDVFNVGYNSTNDPSGSSGTLDNVQGDFTVNENGAGTATLNVSDAANSTSGSLTIDSSTIQRSGAGVITYSNVPTINVTAGDPTDGFPNAIDVESLPSGTSLLLTTTGNSDVVIAQVGQDTSAVLGTITLAGTSTDTLTVNDQADAGNNSYTVSDSSVQTGSITVTITSPFGQEVVYAGTGTNTFDVTPSTDTTISVDGGSSGSNTLTYHTPSSPTDTPVNDGSYTITDTSGHYQPVYYYDFATVTIV
jgi:hypothetical protein